MKKSIILKFSAIIAVTTLSLSYTVMQTIKDYQHCFFQDFNFTSDAIDSIKQKIDEEKYEPYKVCRSYQVCDNKPVSAITKTYYKEYRKKPDFKKQNFSTKEDELNNIDTTIVFTYNSSDKNHLTQKINKKANKHNSEIKKIAFNSNDNKQESNSILNA